MRHFDLFSGYGGFTLALERVYGNKNSFRHATEKQSEEKGLLQDRDISLPDIGDGDGRWADSVRVPITVGFSEIDKYASAVLKYHWPNTKNYGDITKIDWSEVPDFDLLTGGSPCQDLSIAGKRAGLDGQRSGLFYEYMRAVREKKPKYFIWENVKGALSSNKGFDFTAVINEMAEAGYSLWWQVLNAKDFGVPQNRERIFVVGFRDGSPREVFFDREICQESDRELGLQGVQTAMSLRATDYKGTHNNIEQLNNPTHSNNRLYSEQGISPALNNTAQGGNRQPKIAADNTMIRDGRDNRSCLRSGRTPELGVTGKSIRRLTPTECERLMGLPDDWNSKGIIDGKEVEISDSQRYKLCGNGVVVNVVEAIIKNLILN